MAQVIVAACRKWHVEMPSDSALLFEPPQEENSIQGHHKILHSESYRWFDRAATITKNEETRNPWKLCTVSQVEEIKCIWRIMPMWICGILFHSVLAQMGPLFTEQGNAMDNRLATFRVPPASMSLFNFCSVTVGACLYSWILSPFIQRVRLDNKDLTSLQRMGIGIILSMLAISAAALVETKRLSLVDDDNCMRIFWLVPQYVFQGWAQLLFIGGHMDFNYTEVSDAMRSFGVSLSLSCYAVGNYISSVLLNTIGGITSRGGSPGWIPKDLDQGHLDYFYWFLVVFQGFNMLLFLLLSHWHKSVKVYNNEQIHDIVSRD